MHLPPLASIETASVIAGWMRGGTLHASMAARALSDLPAERPPHEPYLPRVWELRHHVSAYDAVYVALAETLGAPLVTCDARLGRAPLRDVVIDVVTRTG